MALSIPQHFLTDEEFRRDEFASLEDFYGFCNERVNEAISVLVQINDALRKYLINKPLRPDEHDLLFSDRSQFKPASVLESSGLGTSPHTNDSTSVDLWPPILEESAAVEGLRRELDRCKDVIENQRLEIMSLESKVAKVSQ